MSKNQIIKNLRELKKEHKEFWENMEDETSPRIINETIKFIKEKIK